MPTTTRAAEEVLKEVRADLRSAIEAAVRKIRVETGLRPKEVNVYVDMISTGPQWNDDPDYLIGEVDVQFKV